MKIHVEEKVCRLDGPGRARIGADSAEADYRAAVTKMVDATLAKEWEVRERKNAFLVVPTDGTKPLIEVKRVASTRNHLYVVADDYRRKVADAVAMLPRIIRMLDEAGHCIEELLLELLPEGSRVPPRTAAFISLMAAAAAEAAEEGGAV